MRFSSARRWALFFISWTLAIGERCRWVPSSTSFMKSTFRFSVWKTMARSSPSLTVRLKSRRPITSTVPLGSPSWRRTSMWRDTLAAISQTKSETKSWATKFLTSRTSTKWRTSLTLSWSTRSRTRSRRGRIRPKGDRGRPKSEGNKVKLCQGNRAQSKMTANLSQMKKNNGRILRTLLRKTRNKKHRKLKAKSNRKTTNSDIYLVKLPYLKVFFLCYHNLSVKIITFLVVLKMCFNCESFWFHDFLIGEYKTLVQYL